jgi:hypothetical protein
MRYAAGSAQLNGAQSDAICSADRLLPADSSSEMQIEMR